MNFRKFLIFPFLSLPLFVSPLKDTRMEIRVLATTEHFDVFINDIIDVEPRVLEHNSESKVVNGEIITPNGDTYSGHSFTIEEPGLYRVIYKAYFGFHEEMQEIEYLCKRKSADFFDITNPVDISYGEYRHNTNDYHHEGVLIDVKNGSEVKFNMPLSVDDFLSEQNIDSGKGYKDRSVGATAKPLIDFMVDPSKLMETDFDALRIRLTDSVDSTNYVDIIISDAIYKADPRSGSASYVRVGASNNWAAGWAWKEVDGKTNQGEYKVGVSGTGLSLSFRGQPQDDNPLMSAQILYCSKTQRFYNYRGSHELDKSYFINDLADPIYYGENVWNGFESGKFYLSIIPSSFSNSSGRLLVKSVGKYVLNSEILTDDIAPVISVNTLGYDVNNLPRPVLGSAYPVFESSVYDNYDSNLTANVSVTYRDSVNRKDIDVAIVDGKFITNKSGAYTIKYSAKDRSGNVSDVTSLRVVTVDHVDDVALQLTTSETSVNSYSEVILPSIADVHVSGGTGRVDVTRKLIDPKGNEVELTSNKFKPTLVGDYKLKFEGQDYIGNKAETIYTIHSLALIKPVFIDEVNLPPILIKGFKYKFEKIRAVETINGENVILNSSIRVNGEFYESSIEATGSVMNVDFIANGQSYTTLLSNTIQIIDIKDDLGKIDRSKYFFGSLNTTQETDDVLLESNADGEVVFANKLNPEDFYIGMRLVNGYENAEFVNFRFTDVLDKNRSITFKLDLTNKHIQAPYLPEISYSLYENQFGLYYNDKTKTFKDTNQNELGSIIKDDKGNVFDGFKKGFYLSIAFVNVSGDAKYKVEQISNQVMSIRNNVDDRIKPTIKYNSELLSEQFKGRDFVYPTFEAFDVLSDISDTSIEIKLNGKMLVKGNQYVTNTFKITESGYYSLIYVARDSSNNQLKITNSVSVFDDAVPTLNVSALPKTSYSVGDKVSIPSYKAGDDSGRYTVDVILILPTNEMRILLHHLHDESSDPKDEITYMLDIDKHVYNASFIEDKTTFKLEMSGSYRLRVVAYDDAFNSITNEQTFTAN